MRYYVMSDTHGFYDEMIESLTKVGYFDYDGKKKIIICGDLLDRGEQTNEICSFIIDLLEKDEIILIRGNHEDLIEQLVKDLPSFGIELLYSHHATNGTLKSLMSIVGMSFYELISMPLLAQKKFYSSDFYKKILPKMVDFYEISKYVFVHGWIPLCDDWRNATKDQWEKARWLNGMELCNKFGIKDDKAIVCGHWHCSWGWHSIKNEREEFPSKHKKDWEKSFEPFYDDGIIAIDGCTAYSGIVNCIVIDN